MQRFGEMLDWLKDNPALTVGLLAAWIVVLIVSLWAGHRHLVSIPPDYFSSRRHPPLHRWRRAHRAVWWTLLVVKNLIAAILIACRHHHALHAGPGHSHVAAGHFLGRHSRKACPGAAHDSSAAHPVYCESTARGANRPPLIFADDGGDSITDRGTKTH